MRRILAAFCVVAAALASVPSIARGPFSGHGGSAPVAATCTILAGQPALSHDSFLSGSASGTVVGAVTVATTGPCSTNTVTITGTDAAKFSLSSAQPPANLATVGILSGGPYSINLVSTIVGATGSPATQPYTITATTPPQSISSIDLSGNTFSALTPNATIGTLSTVMLPVSPAFAGTVALTSTGADHSGTTCTATNGTNFAIAAGVLKSNGTGLAAGSYPGVCVTATDVTISNSPYTQAFTVTASSGGETTISTIAVDSTTASAQTNLPLTVGFPLGTGEITTGDIFRVYDGSTLLGTQEDNRATDINNSVRFAGLSFILPSLAGFESKLLTVKKLAGSYGGTAIVASDITGLASGAYEPAKVTVVLGGSTYTASAATALAASSTWSLTAATNHGNWRSGAYCTEPVVSAPLATGGTPHATLRAWFHILACKTGSGAVTAQGGANPITSIRVDVQLENGYDQSTVGNALDLQYSLKVENSTSLTNAALVTSVDDAGDTLDYTDATPAIDLTTPTSAEFTASIAGTVMTVTAKSSGTINAGQHVYGTGVTAGTKISSNGTGTGGVGTYNITPSQTAVSGAIASNISFTLPTTMTASAPLFTVQDVGRLITKGTDWVVITTFTDSTHVKVENGSSLSAVPVALSDANVFTSGTWTFNGVNHWIGGRVSKRVWQGQQPVATVYPGTNYTGNGTGPAPRLIATQMIQNYAKLASSITPPDETTQQYVARRPFGVAVPIVGGQPGLAVIGEQVNNWAITGGWEWIAPIQGHDVAGLIRYDSNGQYRIFKSQSASFVQPIHFRDNLTGLVSALTKNWTFSSGSSTSSGFAAVLINKPSLALSKNPTFAANGEHQPGGPYLPYLLTGDYKWFEELQFQSWGWAKNNLNQETTWNGIGTSAVIWRLYGGADRFKAWMSRTAAQAYVVTPDSSNLSGLTKASQATWLASNWQWTINGTAPTCSGQCTGVPGFVNDTSATTSIDPNKNWVQKGPRWSGTNPVPGGSGTPNSIWAPWQVSYVLSSLNHQHEIGAMDANGRTFHDWFATGPINMSINTTDIVPTWYVANSFWLSAATVPLSTIAAKNKTWAQVWEQSGIGTYSAYAQGYIPSGTTTLTLTGGLSGTLTATVSGSVPPQDSGYIGHWIGAGNAAVEFGGVGTGLGAGSNGKCQITALLGSDSFTCVTGTYGRTFTTSSYINNATHRWSVGYPPISDVAGKGPPLSQNSHYLGWFRAAVNGASDFGFTDGAAAETFVQSNWPASQSYEVQFNIEPR